MAQRLIDADAFKQQLQISDGFKIDMYGNILTNVNTLNIALERSAIEAEPVRHGKFIGSEFDGYADGNPVFYEWFCSECRYLFEEEPTYRYCPNCGARMDKDE